jgi:YVTN family beta-propeller protein
MRPSARVVAIAGAVALVAVACGGGRNGTTAHTTPTTDRPVHATPAPTLAASAPDVNPVTGAGPNVDVYAHTGVGMLAATVAAVPTRVYVPNSESNTVDVIDPSTYTIVDHYAVGARPQHVVPAYDLSTLYVNNNIGNSLTPIDPVSGKPGPAIPVDDPYNLYFTPDGTRAIVMAERMSRMDFRDPHTWKLIQSVPIAHSGVNHADFTPNGKIMIASCEFSGWLVRIDVPTMRVTGELKVGGAPIDVRSSPDGSVMYVANQGRGGVSIVDPITMSEIAFVHTGVGAHGLYPSRDGKQLYVSNRVEGTISVIDFASRAVVATWPIGGTPDMGGVSADGTQLWLTGRYSQVVYVIDTRSGRLLHTISVGRGPHGLCFFPQPGRYSLGHTGNYR